MEMPQGLLAACALAPAVLMLAAGLLARFAAVATARLWSLFQLFSLGALAFTGVAAWIGPQGLHLPAALQATSFGLAMAMLVQLLGTVIGGFSSRYLQGEPGQSRYVAALAAVLAAVHLLLLADHWVLLIAAWALVGMALQHLLCFYPDRAFARLAAHKKRIADRVADALLVGAAALAWLQVGEGSLSALWAHVEREGMSPSLHLAAVAVVLAVILRTALLPVHGWLIQVMEAPTPVSALLHAGVVNLGGFVLIRFAPLLEHAMPARVLLLVFGLATAVLAGMVMLTRISIKVRLAWSTVAQMGFMLLECAMGLYTLAALHLIGHSLYKAHAFLSSSTVVRQTRLQALHEARRPSTLSLVAAPVLAVAVVLALQGAIGQGAWPAWWSALLALAWAPLLWLPAAQGELASRAGQVLAGVLMIAGLTVAAQLAHALPLGIVDTPHDVLGLLALSGMAALYLGLALLQMRPQALAGWRRWSYAGFYVDEAYTRLALQLWPTRWVPESRARDGAEAAPALAVEAR
ncbi:NADH-quinone oxidoreductase subunit L [Niveibacterium umoris]|uniref:Probable inorganic carbon transporter subunit DabB n=1 Tax=Niveibacterium umoris TaxID=1193620 RepID=A0A840BP52_9RHOO|nr:NADH-quinone oxidoreductase subunit L [Niveibacterium umoris]MBB4014770.1 NAD(P)H-quinone oxidoreductase subunit 5 [Niveibacterium umoris]